MILRQIFYAALGAIFLASCTASPFAGKADPHIYLVRHAEKEPGRDPNLPPDGKVRAQALAERLKDTQLTAIYSTDYKRTRQTAAPTALGLGLPVVYYDPAKLDEFAAQLLAQTGNVLVVGHSNTTPQLVAALGGDGGTPIVEASEYDRLYVVTRKGQTVVTDLQRYGTPSPE